MSRLNKAIIFLDIVALLMTAGWIIFSIFKGITNLELTYNYIYSIVVATSLILNLMK